MNNAVANSRHYLWNPPPPSSRNMWTGMWIIIGKNQSLILLASLTILNGLYIEKKLYKLFIRKAMEIIEKYFIYYSIITGDYEEGFAFEYEQLQFAETVWVTQKIEYGKNQSLS